LLALADEALNRVEDVPESGRSLLQKSVEGFWPIDLFDS
jgi:hypothetical protein